MAFHTFLIYAHNIVNLFLQYSALCDPPLIIQKVCWSKSNEEVCVPRLLVGFFSFCFIEHFKWILLTCFANYELCENFKGCSYPKSWNVHQADMKFWFSVKFELLEQRASFYYHCNVDGIGPNRWCFLPAHLIIAPMDANGVSCMSNGWIKLWLLFY